jgi:hypothetical protein
VTSPPLAKSTPNGRVYEHPITGETAISVTTAIKSLDKPALVPWAAKMAAEYAVQNWDLLSPLGDEERIDLIKGAHRRSSGKAADLGTAVHDACDHWVRNEPMPSWEKGVEPFMEQFVDFLEKRRPEFVRTEVTVWNRTYGYAGTFDWLAYIGGRLTLGDHKTGKGVYPEVGLQLTALAHAEFILSPDGIEEPLPEVELFGALHLRPRSWALIPVQRSEETWRAFLAALELTRWTRETAPNILGPRLREVQA